MNDSGSGVQSATKTIDLKARLQQMKTQHTSRAREIETEAFASFELDLKTLLRAEAATFASGLESLNTAFNDQRMRLREEILLETNRLIWMVRLPMILTALTCVAMLGFCLAWFSIQRQERVRMSPWEQDGKRYLIVDDPAWKLCQAGHIEKGSGSGSKTDTIILQPCKPLE
jgi:hypothetical protein